MRAAERLPRGAHSITVGVDRTSVAMAETVGGPPPRLRHHKRQPPALTTVRWRMPYVGTIAVNDCEGRTLASWRFAATVAEGPAEMLERMAAEVLHLLAERADLPIVVIQDGAPELWRLMDEWEANFQIPITLRLVDRYHVDERLAQVAEILEPDKRGRWVLLETWKASMRRTDLAIERLCASFRVLVRTQYAETEGDEEDDLFAEPTSLATIHGHRAATIESHLTYFFNARTRFSYATARRQGFPIGSGVTEGACKSVFAARCKRSGQRWHEGGLSPCVHLRTQYLNGRLSGVVAAHIGRQMEALRAA